MSDEASQFILGDAAAAASEEIGGPRRFFKRKRKREAPALTHCENCGAPLTGEYCAKCGQHAIDYRRSLFQLLVDAADSFFNWDTKFFRTIGTLLLKPWRLTNDFNAGRRVRHVHPLRLYLLASIAFFLMLRMIDFSESPPIELSAEDRAELSASLGRLTGPDSPLGPEERVQIDLAREKLTQVQGDMTEEEQRAVADSVRSFLKSSVRKKLKPEERAALRGLIAGLPYTKSTPTPHPDAPKTPDSQKEGAPIVDPNVVVEKPTLPASPTASPSPRRSLNFQIGTDDKIKTPFEAWMEKRIKDKVGEDGTRGKLFLETLRNNIPTMMLCCIPLFAFILKVLYVWQRRYYVEHLVYALHVHTLVYIGVIVIVLINLGMAGWPEALRVLTTIFLSMALFVQIFLSILRVYRQGFFFSSFKFLLGGVGYFVILIIGIGATAFVTLLLP